MAKNTGKKLALGALIAGAAGYVTGILTAPKSGKETRKDIGDAAHKAKSEAEKQLKNLHKEANALIKIVQSNSGNFKGAVKTGAEKALAQANDAKDKISQLLSSMRDAPIDDKELKSAIKEANDAIKHLKKYASQYGQAAKDAVKKK